jgi:hypothetical protein
MVRDNLGFELSAQWRDAAIVFGFGVALRIAALVAMVFVDRDKKL